MANCEHCNALILFGGERIDGHRYCNRTCAQRGTVFRAADDIPSDIIEQRVMELHNSACPQCKGTGPVDIHQSHLCISAIVVTWQQSKPAVSCRACARKRQLGAAAASAVLGWWGFPFGLVFTPVAIGRNVAGMMGKDQGPSEKLRSVVKADLGARMYNLQKEAAQQQRQSVGGPG